MDTSTTASNNMVKPIKTSNKMPLMVAIGIVVVILGLGVGFLISSKKVGNNNQASTSITVSKTEAGLKDPSTVKDITTATGDLKSGGIKGEGTVHLERPGGAIKYVYLTSTTVDMSPFVGKKVQVWGLTLAAKYAPWFMDVMKIKVVE